MNSFEGKYIRIASQYLDEKMKQLNVRRKGSYELQDKKESRLQRIVTGIFKS